MCGTFYVYGNIISNLFIDEVTLEEVEEMYKQAKEKFNIIVILDYNNMAYSVIPVDEKEIENKIVKTTVIASNENNNIYQLSISDESMAKIYFNTYKDSFIDDFEYAYNHLDEEYKNKKFAEFEDFKEFIEENREDIFKNNLLKWKREPYEDYTQFICQDDKGRYYIFKETAPMQYTVVLDTYTIDIPQFIEKYDACNPQEKVVLNIEKIKQALNSGDYSYVYSKLADSFKNNKYKTEKEFSEYMENAIYNNFDMKYKEFSNEGEIYIYNVEIKNLDNEEDKIINMQIIMQLKEERDFVMSFSIKE